MQNKQFSSGGQATAREGHIKDIKEVHSDISCIMTHCGYPRNKLSIRRRKPGLLTKFTLLLAFFQSVILSACSDKFFI